MIRIAIGFVAFAIMTAQAYAYPSWWRGTLPGCSEPRVLAKVQRTIAYGAPRVLGFHLSIQAFDGISQDAVKAHGPSWIDRRYWKAPPIFDLIQRIGRVAVDEMDRTFNNGIGMILIADPRGVDKAMRGLKSLREPCCVIGEIKKGSRGVSFAA